MTAAPLRDTHITKLRWHHTGALISSRADLLCLGALFRLAAVSPRSAVFLPLLANDRRHPSVSHWATNQGLADLLIMRPHHAPRHAPVRLRPGVHADRVRTRLRGSSRMSGLRR
jgi:hypothetical protein